MGNATFDICLHLARSGLQFSVTYKGDQVAHTEVAYKEDFWERTVASRFRRRR